ncbi:MAG: hypothetical protein ACRCVT_10090 [Leadbetterella sp.]
MKNECVWSVEYYHMTKEGEFIAFDYIKASSIDEAIFKVKERSIHNITEIILAYPTKTAIADITYY